MDCYVSAPLSGQPDLLIHLPEIYEGRWKIFYHEKYAKDHRENPQSYGEKMEFSICIEAGVLAIFIDIYFLSLPNVLISLQHFHVIFRLQFH